MRRIGIRTIEFSLGAGTACIIAAHDCAAPLQWLHKMRSETAERHGEISKTI